MFDDTCRHVKKKSDIEKTTFSTNNRKYEFTRLPFGLKNAPSMFLVKRKMNASHTLKTTL